LDVADNDEKKSTAQHGKKMGDGVRERVTKGKKKGGDPWTSDREGGMARY